jgi:hypothetical protein
MPDYTRSREPRKDCLTTAIGCRPWPFHLNALTFVVDPTEALNLRPISLCSGNYPCIYIVPELVVISYGAAIH